MTLTTISQLAALSTLAASALLCGCGSTPGAKQVANPASISGIVHGGQQPVSGAAVHLYQAGTSGDGQGAADLLKTAVTTDAHGNFTLTGDYTCPSATTQVYMVASGGNPGLAAGTTNAAAMLMTALGDCGNLGPQTFVTINEATTAGAVWALAQFLGPSGNVGASGTNATGLRNAFLTAANLVDSAAGVSPGPNLPSGAIVEKAKLYTLADVLGVCINSDGTTGCNPLFAASTNGGVTPGNTLDAALAIVRNPSAHLTDVLYAAGAQGPFQPVLAAAPNDWTMTVTYAGGGLNLPTALGVDGFGNVWVANYFGGVVSEFTTAGQPVAANGYGGGGLQESYGLAIDASNNVWVANEETDYSVNSASGSMTSFNQAGQVISGSGYTGGGIYFPLAAAADSNGSVWVADYGRSSATLYGVGGAAISSGNGYGGALVPLPLAVAVDANHNGWLAVEGGVTRIGPDGTTATFPCCDEPSGIAVDQGGNVWLADYYAARLVEVSSTGVVLLTPTQTGGLNYPESVAIDGAGTVWCTNFRGGSVSAFAGYSTVSPGTALSPAKGFGVAAGLVEPFGMAIDASGNVWATSLATNRITQIVGVASPIQTPLLGPPRQP